MLEQILVEINIEVDVGWTWRGIEHLLVDVFMLEVRMHLLETMWPSLQLLQIGPQLPGNPSMGLPTRFHCVTLLSSIGKTASAGDHVVLLRQVEHLVPDRGQVQLMRKRMRLGDIELSIVVDPINAPVRLEPNQGNKGPVDHIACS